MAEKEKHRLCIQILANILAPVSAHCVTLGRLPRLSVHQLARFDNIVGLVLGRVRADS